MTSQHGDKVKVPLSVEGKSALGGLGLIVFL